jgi:molecular chaperone DnaK (HSP70)
MLNKFSNRNPIRIGIDFGTTHTSAAFYDGNQIHAIPLDPANDNPTLLRSMIYVNRAQQIHLGVDAVKTFLEQDTGREVIFEEKVVGTLTNTVASHDAQENVTIIYDTIIEDDVGIRGRLLQSIKTGLRGDSYQGTNIFGRYYTLQELIALILRHVRKQAICRRSGCRPTCRSTTARSGTDGRLHRYQLCAGTGGRGRLLSRSGDRAGDCADL